MTDNIILVGKHITEHSDEIAEGYVQVEFDVENLLDEIPSGDIRKYAKENFDLTPLDELDDVDTEDMVSELQDRGYNFIRGADDEQLITVMESRGYKCLYEYNEEYYEYLKVSNLDIQDMRLLNEITKRFIDATVFEKVEMHKAIMGFPY